MFGYACCKCGKGLVRTTKFINFLTKVYGIECIIPTAKIGVCSKCGARHFDMKEVRRWEREKKIVSK